MNAPTEEPLIVSAPLESTVTIPDSYTEYRNNVLAGAATVLPFAYPNDDALTHAVTILGGLSTIGKQVEKTEAAIREPVNAWLKQVRGIRDTFLAPVITETQRVSKIIAAYQAAEREVARLRDREAQKAIEDAARKAQEAAREIEQAKTAEAKLAAELKAESAELAQTQAQATLATPANTPKGLVTRVRYDFEIILPFHFLAAMPEFWAWKKSDETITLKRSDLLKELNKDQPLVNIAMLLPDDGVTSVMHAGKGIRVFLDTRVSARA